MATSGNAAVGSNPQPVQPAKLASTAGQKAVPKVDSAGSPWEDDLELQETPPKNKPSVIGSLDENDIAGGIPQAPTPFNVPKNIDEKVGQKVPAAQYISNTKPPASQPSAKTSEPIPLKPELPLAETGTTYLAKGADGVQAVAPDSNSASSAQAPSVGSRFGFLKSSKVTIIIGFVAFLLGLILLTEMGVFSIGLEKVYGAIGIEKIWGGLPKTVQPAIVRSAISMKEHPNFKARGSLTLKIDKTTKSPVTKPLLSRIDTNFKLTQVDSELSPAIRAILAATTTSSSSSSSSFDYADDLTSSSYSSSAYDTTTDDASTDLTDDTSSSSTTSSDSSSQSDYPSYQYQGNASKDVSADFTSKFGQSGSETDFVLKRLTGESNVSLKNVDGALYVQSESPVKFNRLAKSSDWTEYKLDELKGKTVQKDIFSLNTKAGFSAKGNRLGNEKVGKIRTYRYKLDSLEIGSSLTALGISSDMVQSISGDVWIGVKDKLIRKIDLTITAPPSSSVSQIHLVAEFFDYDASNNIGKPASSLSSADSQNLTGDTKRKADLALIAEAVEAYKESNGSYPVASSLAKLGSPENALSRVLVPEFIDVLPTDPKFAEGWYYAYKSDGSTFSLSSRLESTTDPEAKLTNGIYLYFVYNK